MLRILKLNPKVETKRVFLITNFIIRPCFVSVKKKLKEFEMGLNGIIFLKANRELDHL
jgi:hypothetical protein